MIRHQGFGRVRRPKNILGTDRTTVAGNASSDVIDNTDPVDDLQETISAVALNKTTRVLTITTADALGTNVFDGATGRVLTDGLHPLFDHKFLPILSTVDGSNQTLVRIPDDINANQLASLSLSAKGTLVQQTTHGVRTENARFLHLYLKNGAGNARTVEVFGYNYAFGRWAPLHIPMGEGATATALYAKSEFAINNNTRMVVIPIDGIDRVYFKLSHDDSNITVSAAISTF